MNCGQEFTLLLGSQRGFDREEQMIDSFYIKKHIFSIQQFIIKLLILKISNYLLSRYCNDLKILQNQFSLNLHEMMSIHHLVCRTSSSLPVACLLWGASLTFSLTLLAELGAPPMSKAALSLSFIMV